VQVSSVKTDAFLQGTHSSKVAQMNHLERIRSLSKPLSVLHQNPGMQPWAAKPMGSCKELKVRYATLKNGLQPIRSSSEPSRTHFSKSVVE
jgi:hypothetical protein